MDARKSAIFAFEFLKPILQTITHLIQYTVLEIQFWSVKCMTVTVKKKFKHFHSCHQAMQVIAIIGLGSKLYEKKPLQSTFKRI